MSSKTKRFDVVGLGCVAVDDILYVAGYPKADEKVPVQLTERMLGGLTGRALVAAASFGVSCSYAAVLGEDDFSKYVLQKLRGAGVDVSGVKIVPKTGPIHSTVVVSKGDRTRNSFYDLTNWVGAEPDWPPVEFVQAGQVLLLDNYFGLTAAIRAARIARDSGIPVVLDLEGEWEYEMHELFKLANHVILARTFAERLLGNRKSRELLDELWSEEKDMLVITEGNAGCWYRSSMTASHHWPASEIVSVNTTGCGDVFHGVYAATLALGLPAEDRIKLATIAAGQHAEGKALEGARV